MSEHRAQLRWTRTSHDFTYESYNRAHEILFKDGAVVLPSSSAPEFRGDPERVDPEEAFVASLSGCHMLTFLAICARKRLTLDAYDDDASGRLEKADGGRLWMARVTLRPLVRVAMGIAVDAELLAALHHHAHADCFIANSVKTEVLVLPRA
jgi:organic hydroperoxide reductase OsmC/OhrA